MEEARFPIVKGAKKDLGGAASVEGALTTENFSFHEAEVRAAEDEEDVAGFLPLVVPEFLDDAREFGAFLDHPLEFIEYEDKGLFGFLGALGDDSAEGTLPVIDGEHAEEGFVEDFSSELKEVFDLERGW